MDVGENDQNCDFPTQNNHNEKKRKISSTSEATDVNNSTNSQQEKNQLISPLVEAGITCSDIETTVRVLNTIAALKNKRTSKKKKKNPKNDAKEKEETIENTGPEMKEEDGLSYYRHASLRPIRKPLGQIYEHLHKKILFNGLSEEEHYKQLIAERTLKRQKMAESSRQQQYLNSATLRKQRLSNLDKLKSDADVSIVKEEQDKLNQVLNMMIPDGAVEENISTTQPTALLTNGSSTAEKKSDESLNKPKILPKLRSCYVCKVHFRMLHHFYDQLCPECAKLNYKKRHATADLSQNYIAIVTGSRIKIGFQTVLKLLRAGATVIATTRFPNSAIKAYLAQNDVSKWKERLHLYGLDLRDVIGIEAFVDFVRKKYGKVDIVVNNACQTVRRPVGYYRPVVEEEIRLWKEYKEKKMEEGRIFLTGCREFEEFRRRQGGNRHQFLSNGYDRNSTNRPVLENEQTKQEKDVVLDVEKIEQNDKIIEVSSSVAKDDEIDADIPQNSIPDFESTGLCQSAFMSQTVLLPDDANPLSSAAIAVKDVNNQALDIRRTNSWILKLEQVSTPEILETMIINAVAPFILNSRLLPLMMPTVDSDGKTTLKLDSFHREKFIINVSAMEGKFYRYKMPNHPHTNMAKAALNMMTRTSSEELAKKYNIYMNSVDTGWINDENPLERASKTAKTNLFQTPIDEIDAAARILDPVFSVLSEKNGTSKREYGKFFKDYRESEW